VLLRRKKESVAGGRGGGTGNGRQEGGRGESRIDALRLSRGTEDLGASGIMLFLPKDCSGAFGGAESIVNGLHIDDFIPVDYRYSSSSSGMIVNPTDSSVCMFSGS